jgi:hypothetical protein
VLRLRREAAENLRHLVEGATADGEELVVASAYRSYEDQRASHARLMSVFGADADGMSAAPGHSQHQLGTAGDFTNAAAGYQIWMPFTQTSAYWWLEHHAFQYGFVLAYPRGKEEHTGYRWEPWHYRYVGVEDAKRLEKKELSLQEFLDVRELCPAADGPEGGSGRCDRTSKSGSPVVAIGVDRHREGSDNSARWLLAFSRRLVVCEVRLGRGSQKSTELQPTLLRYLDPGDRRTKWCS